MGRVGSLGALVCAVSYGEKILFYFVFSFLLRHRVGWGRSGLSVDAVSYGEKICFISFSYYRFVVESGFWVGAWSVPFLMGKCVLFRFPFLASSVVRRACVTYRDVSLFFFFIGRCWGARQDGLNSQPLRVYQL